MKKQLTNIPWHLHLSQYLLIFHMLEHREKGTNSNQRWWDPLDPSFSLPLLSPVHPQNLFYFPFRETFMHPSLSPPYYLASLGRRLIFNLDLLRWEDPPLI